MPKDLLFGGSKNTVRLQGIFSTKVNPIPKWNRYIEAIKYAPILKVLHKIVLDSTPWINYGEKELTEADKLRAQRFYQDNLDAIFEKMAFGTNSDSLTLSRIERFLEIMILTGQKEQSREPSTSTQRTSIVCMTIHKSKGLEFHTVILPYMPNTIGAQVHKGTTDISLVDGRIGFGYSVRMDNWQLKVLNLKLSNM